MTYSPPRDSDKQGRKYAKLNELKQGSKVIVDDGFPCMKAWSEREVFEEGKELYIKCRSGMHSLEGQLEFGTEILIGIYHAEGFKK